MTKQPKNYCRFCGRQVHPINALPDKLKGEEMQLEKPNADGTTAKFIRWICAGCFAGVYNLFLQATQQPGRLQQLGIEIQTEKKVVTPEGAGRIVGTDNKPIN